MKLSNRFGSETLRVDAVTIARRTQGADVVRRSMRTLRFGKKPSVTIPPGGEVVSDPRTFAVRAFEDVAVSLHVGASGPATRHWSAFQTSYATEPGSGVHVADPSGAAFTRTLGAWPFLTDVEVQAPRRKAGAVVLIGDSITDGFGAPANANQRYPDFLARRLAAAGVRLAVQNAGISGNRVLRDGQAFGPKLLDRLDRDAIDQAGASIALLMEGTNDLQSPPSAADAVIAGLQQAVDRLRAAGFRVILGTQTPSLGGLEHGSPAAVAARNAINDWIRTAGAADGVVDFHAALRDPLDPDDLRPEYDTGDHLHPNAAGYQAMADAVDLQLLADPPCR